MRTAKPSINSDVRSKINHAANCHLAYSFITTRILTSIPKPRKKFNIFDWRTSIHRVKETGTVLRKMVMKHVSYRCNFFITKCPLLLEYASYNQRSHLKKYWKALIRINSFVFGWKQFNLLHSYRNNSLGIVLKLIIFFNKIMFHKHLKRLAFVWKRMKSSIKPIIRYEIILWGKYWYRIIVSTHVKRSIVKVCWFWNIWEISQIIYNSCVTLHSYKVCYRNFSIILVCIRLLNSS